MPPKRKNSISILLIISIILITIFAIPASASRPFWKINPKILFKVKTEQKVVALSIDDAPSAEVTPEILRLLAQYDAKATFFVIGKKALADPDMIDGILAGGHEIGNHTMSNRFTIFMGRDQFRRQLKDFEKIVPITGKPKLFRPGGGFIFDWQVEMAEKMEYKCCLGTLYYSDMQLKSPSIVATLTMMNLGPGKIIILHDGTKGRTPETLEKILPRIKARGYKVVTISELLKLQE
jgi:peptidoglycan-N-acetylglucosamine deacetylase